MKIISGVIVLILFCACTEVEDKVIDLRSDDHDRIVEQEPTTDVITSDNIEIKLDSITSEVKKNKSEWSYKVTSISENNWGYQLFQKEKMVINQTSIPSVQGVNGFDSQEKAERTAEHILTKLENGIFPPTVDKEELDSLNVLRD